jgi:hypothetical protein
MGKNAFPKRTPDGFEPGIAEPVTLHNEVAGAASAPSAPSVGLLLARAARNQWLQYQGAAENVKIPPEVMEAVKEGVKTVVCGLTGFCKTQITMRRYFKRRSMRPWCSMSLRMAIRPT